MSAKVLQRKRGASGQPLLNWTMLREGIRADVSGRCFPNALPFGTKPPCGLIARKAGKAQASSSHTLNAIA